MCMRQWGADSDIFDELLPKPVPTTPEVRYNETGAERFIRLRERYNFVAPIRAGKHQTHRGTGC